MVNKSKCDSKYPCFVPDLRKSLVCHHWNLSLMFKIICKIFIDNVYQVEKVLLYSYVFECFFFIMSIDFLMLFWIYWYSVIFLFKPVIW